jgi:ribonuclease HI
MSDFPKVHIWTDGGCRPSNPGPGGYGVVLRYNGHCKELSGGFRHTTNNRMELLAAIVGLESLNRPCQVTLHSDSKYLVDAINLGWARRWQANGWKRNKQGDKALNPDLWQRLLELIAQHQVECVWVRGHSGVADNERCDALARQAAQAGDLPVDVGMPV